LLATVVPAYAQHVDAIYHNGFIMTMSGSTPSYVEALAVREGKIAFVGSKEVHSR
jgi:predicted amidohydrolase YtcJ